MSALPSSDSSALAHISFYKFVRIVDTEGCAAWLRSLCEHLSGSILLANEGINAMLAGTPAALDTFEATLSTDQRFAAFTNIHFKRSPCKTTPFHRMKVKVKREIVPLGVDNVDATCQTGIDLSPQEWRELLAEDNVVVLDNRNSFEYHAGRFKGAIDPGVHNFRDFPKYVQEHIEEWKANNTKVAMYCTGGIRCEKTSAWMLDLGLPVYQLQGGILNFFEKMPDAEKDWEGDCFVFDNRVALNTKLEESGLTLQDIYAHDPAEAWRLARAEQLAKAIDADEQ